MPVIEIATLPVAGDIAVSTALRRWRGSWKPWAKPSSEPSDWRRGTSSFCGTLPIPTGCSGVDRGGGRPRKAIRVDKAGL